MFLLFYLGSNQFTGQSVTWELQGHSCNRFRLHHTLAILCLNISSAEGQPVGADSFLNVSINAY